MALTKDERATLKEAANLIQRETDEDGGRIIVQGFGSFTRKTRDARQGRNPKTGAALTIPARSVLTFKASKQGTERIL